MIATIFKEFSFEAAHKLPNVPLGHKCRQLHGHSYKVKVSVTGEVDEGSGFVIDFGDISAVMKPVINRFDHSCLNDHFINPTAENVAWWIAQHLSSRMDGRSVEVEVWETATAGARCSI